ncbi:MAG TPA: hypothetical protein VGB55_01805 [Tepidisphaeraceae bacterium]|jgi:hypothetical protein
MTEWTLQGILTKQWSECGLMLEGQRNMLAAWEVMVPSWDINDATIRWNEPSIDFLAVDIQQRFTAIEVKRGVFGIKPVWQVLCQVTHRAVELDKTFTYQNLDRAYRACRSGHHGRVPRCVPESFGDSFKAFFGTEFDGQKRSLMRACVAAAEFGESWHEILDEFNSLSAIQLRAKMCSELTSVQARRDLTRIKGVCDEGNLPINNPILALPLEYFAN